MKHLPPPYLCALRISVGGQPASAGSGLLVGPDLVLTALHVIIAPFISEAERDLDTPLPAGRAREEAEVRVAVGAVALERSAFRKATLFAEDSLNDLALVKLDRPVRTVAPPPFAAGRAPDCQLVFHGHRDGRFQAQETPAAGQTVQRLMDDGDAPAFFSLSSDLPAGYSGGPVIAVRDDGSHCLWGVSTFGGTGAARLGFAGWGAIHAFLSRQKCLAAFDALSVRVTAPGVPAEVSLPVAGGQSLAFRPLDRASRSLFRARTPVSAALAEQLGGRSPRPGASALPAHVTEAGEVTALVAALASTTGEKLRLPRLSEVMALGEASGTATSDVGLPLRLAAYERSLAPPTGSVEWVEGDSGQAEAWHFRRDGETCLAAGQLPAGHARFAVRPLLLGD